MKTKTEIFKIISVLSSLYEFCVTSDITTPTEDVCLLAAIEVLTELADEGVVKCEP